MGNTHAITTVWSVPAAARKAGPVIAITTTALVVVALLITGWCVNFINIAK